jgi:ABC-type phosphate transport system substrate-binding protein
MEAKKIFFTSLLIVMLVTACNPAPQGATQPSAETQATSDQNASASPTLSTDSITVQYTAAAIPWLADLQNCAGGTVVMAEQRAADLLDLQTIDLAIRIGQPDALTSPAYQIGSEDILVISNRQNPINTLTADEVRGLFTGSIQTWQEINGSDSPVQVWVFASAEDVQQIFEQTVLGGAMITSNAHLAAGPNEMSQAIANDVNAVGILTRHWKAGNVSEVSMVATAPVLAITAGEPQGVVPGILACLQK